MQVEAKLRIMGTEIKSSNFRGGLRALRNPSDPPEIEISVTKASGTYNVDGVDLPISVHIDTYPGYMPCVGDHITVTLES